MAERIVFTRPDGGVSVVCPAPGVDIAVVLARSIPGDATDVTVVDETALSTDREFRNAWRQFGGVVSIDMPAAREIHAERINAAKRTVARDLVEREAMGEDMTAEKAALRAADVQAQIAAAPNPVALKAVWPLQLPRYNMRPFA